MPDPGLAGSLQGQQKSHIENVSLPYLRPSCMLGNRLSMSTKQRQAHHIKHCKHTSMTSVSSDKPIDSLSGCAIAYLILPIIGFFLWFFEPAYGILLTFATLFGLWHLVGWPLSSPTSISRPVVMGLGSIAIIWTAFGGAGHFFYANSIDWMVRDALLHDLILAEGLPAYRFGGDETYILRAPLAYDLPAAAAGRIVGLYFADKLLWAWTATGTFLFLALLPFESKLSLRLAAAMVIPVVFSGMDIVGFMFPDYHWGAFPFFHAKLDWWLLAPPRVAYFANTTQLFWSPHHVIPGWLAAALLYRHFGSARATRIAIILAFAIPLWSPLTWLGAIPLLALTFIRREYRLFSLKERIGILALIPGAIIIILYLTLNATNIEFGATFDDATRNGQFAALSTTGKIVWYFVSYSFFLVVEFVVLAMLVRGAMAKVLFYASIAILALLPSISIGPYNDLAMRASIPALTLLCIATVRFVQSPDISGSGIRLWTVYLVLALGSVTAFFEFYRASTRPQWDIVESQNLVDVLHGSPEPHYMVKKDANFLGPIMRETSTIPRSLDYFYLCQPRHPEILARKPIAPGRQRGPLIPLGPFMSNTE